MPSFEVVTYRIPLSLFFLNNDLTLRIIACDELTYYSHYTVHLSSFTFGYCVPYVICNEIEKS
jgi:hypothetical protein